MSIHWPTTAPLPRLAATTFLVLACLIVLLAVFVRVWNLPGESVDGDELFSRRVATADSRTALKLIEQDLVHPPLYYFLLKAALPLTGDGATGIRIVSLTSGIGSIVVVLFLGVFRPALRLPALAATALLAVNQVHIFYSQQARSYALYGLLVCLLLLWTLVLADQDGHAPGTCFWVTGTMLMSALVYTHYVGAVFIAAVMFAIWISSIERRKKILTTLTAAIAALGFMPWVLIEFRVFTLSKG